MSTVNADAMRRYDRTRDDLVARLLVLEDALDESSSQRLRSAREMLARGKFVLAVVGEFSSGKSYLLNALLGKFRREVQGETRRLVGLLAVDINPSTATITELENGERDEALAYYESGRTERIPLDRLNRFIAVGSGDVGTLHAATTDESDAPTRVRVTTPSEFLARGFLVADTPGLASANPAHRRATLGFLPGADAVLYLIDTQQPFSEGDASFLGIVRRHIDSIFIVQTKIDLWNRLSADGRPAWQNATERIERLAAIHAPGTYVYPLSARDYVEGTFDEDSERVATSRFLPFLEALDASLIARTGRSRLRRARDAAVRVGGDAIARIDGDLAMLSLPTETLHAELLARTPKLVELDARIEAQRAQLRAESSARRARLAQECVALGEELELALAQAFDTTDIAKLRDRARLHVLVDRVTAHAVEAFAKRAALLAVEPLEAIEHASGTDIPLRFSLVEAAAVAFGGQLGTSLWSGDPADAIAATIVLDAIGGPAIALVHAISMRFAAAAADTYMKRELIADLRASIFPALRSDVAELGERIATNIERIDDALDAALLEAGHTARDADIGSVERALAAVAENDVPARVASIRLRRATIDRELNEIERIANAFLAEAPEIAPADPGTEMLRRAHSDPSLDAAAYARGLRPQRWRVAIVGALRRGKSALIDAFAGSAVLGDEVPGMARFPIHVRYGDRHEAFALDAEGAWGAIDTASVGEAAQRSPVLVLTPWNFPRELVLVHAPAFDSGDIDAEDIALMAARRASEVLCLFSRQLSERELRLYERIAEFGKPMLFAHTMADNESASDRRNVVELARRYLADRKIPAARVFTVSAQEYAGAVANRRAPAGWNELGALRETLDGHATAHMERLARLERSSAEIGRELARPAADPVPSGRAPAFLRRLFGR